METVKSKMTRALSRFVAGPADRLTLEDVAPNKVSGMLVSSHFDGKSLSERQDLIWDELDKVLDPYERTRVVIVFADTPEEHKLYKDTA